MTLEETYNEKLGPPELFSVPVLGAIVHTSETKAILGPHVMNREQSEFVRESILNFAKEYGFEALAILKRPKYILSRKWNEIIELQKRSYRINYTYAIAFYWLLSLPQFEGYNKSKLIREILVST